MSFKIVIIAERIHDNCCFAFLLFQKMPVYKHFRPRNSKSSQFTSYTLSDAGRLENFAKRHRKVIKIRAGVIVAVARKQHDVGFYVKGGRKYYTRYYTAILSNFGRKLETLRPGFPTKTII